MIVISYIYCLRLFSKSETEYLLRLAENVSIEVLLQGWLSDCTSAASSLSILNNCLCKY